MASRRESKFQQAVKTTAVELGYKYLKHADKATWGIPDISVSGNRQTAWLELKVLHDADEDVGSLVEPVQLATLRDLRRTCHRAWVIAVRRPSGMLELYDPFSISHNPELRSELEVSYPTITECLRYVLASGPPPNIFQL